jgi:hypothetical protein
MNSKVFERKRQRPYRGTIPTFVCMHWGKPRISHPHDVSAEVTNRAPPEYKSIEQSGTRFLHACSALCKCANWLCRTCSPHHTVAGRSSVSLRVRSPSPPFADAVLLSPATCRAVPSRARVHGTAKQHTSSHTVRCARLVHLCYRVLHLDRLLKMINAYTVLVGKPKRIIPHWRLTRRREYTIKMHPKEQDRVLMGWTRLN